LNGRFQAVHRHRRRSLARHHDGAEQSESENGNSQARHGKSSFFVCIKSVVIAPGRKLSHERCKDAEDAVRQILILDFVITAAMRHSTSLTPGESVSGFPSVRVFQTAVTPFMFFIC